MLRLTALATIVVLLMASVFVAASSGHYAEAMKSKVKKIHENHYSYWYGNVVCGDELCDGPGYTKWNQKYRTFKSPYDKYTNPATLSIKGH